MQQREVSSEQSGEQLDVTGEKKCHPRVRSKRDCEEMLAGYEE